MLFRIIDFQRRNKRRGYHTDSPCPHCVDEDKPVITYASVCRSCGNPLTVTRLFLNSLPTSIAFITIVLAFLTARQVQLANVAYKDVQTLKGEVHSIALSQTRTVLLLADGGVSYGGMLGRHEDVIHSVNENLINLIPDRERRDSWFNHVSFQKYLEYDYNKGLVILAEEKSPE